MQKQESFFHLGFLDLPLALQPLVFLQFNAAQMLRAIKKSSSAPLRSTVLRIVIFVRCDKLFGVTGAIRCYGSIAEKNQKPSRNHFLEGLFGDP